MQFRRRNKPVLLLCLAAALAGCRSDSERRLGASTRRELELGRAAAEQWLQAAAGSEITQPEAVAVGYLERLRLGLGSPFRLVDLALSDPRLPDSVRTRLASALLDRVLAGNTYHIDARVLDRAGTLGVRSWPGLGARHLALIERTVNEAKDPRAAEAAIRMGYSMAAAEGLVSNEAPLLAGSVAALRVDRVLARQDAAQLLDAADETPPASTLLRQWRAERRFEVEQPRLGALRDTADLAAIRGALKLVEALRVLGLETASRGLPAVAQAPAEPTYLLPAAARQLDRAEAQLGAPPQTPIVISARQLSRDVADGPGLTREQRALRSRFGSQALNEESFAVELTRLELESAHDVAPARAALQGAVALRAYAQEPVWFPGQDGPSKSDLQEKYGLGDVTFDRSVRAEWRPYYRRMLMSALDDLRRVLPALDVRGLRVHFGATPDNSDALAIHEPGRRRLLLPPLTSAGTIAHEVAHDIDWQTALRRYRIRGDYATDRAARGNDLLTAQVRNLASASLATRVPDARLSAHARRPAEIFARNVDWYVAVSLAGEGRRNGYLSSVQDELITGYGTVRPPDVSGAAGDALMTILSELAPVYRDQRAAFRALYGTTRGLRSYDLVRRILEAPLATAESRSFEVELEQLRAARSATLQALEGPPCAPALGVTSELQVARRELVLLATESRARGLAAQHLQRASLGDRTELIRQLYRGPMPVAQDSASALLVNRFADAVNNLANELTGAAATPFDVLPLLTCNAALSLPGLN